MLAYFVYNLYSNTVLDDCVILSVCSSAIETTFPLSNFKTEHIFGILIALRKLFKSFGAPPAPQIILNIPQSHEDSEYVLSFEIGQREGGFYSGRTDTQTETQNHRTTQYRISI